MAPATVETSGRLAAEGKARRQGAGYRRSPVFIAFPSAESKGKAMTMTDARLEKELRDLQEIGWAILATLVGSIQQEQLDIALKRGRDARWLHRWMGDGTPFWESDPEISGQVQERLRQHEQYGASPPRGGLYTLEEVAIRGRETIAAIPGIGPKAMEAIDAALEKHGIPWADATVEEVA